MAAILGAGAYFIVFPARDDIARIDRQIEEKQEQIKTANDLREREHLLNQIVVEKRERAETVHIGFYPEMTTTEATAMVQEILFGANRIGGYTSIDGIDVTDIGEAALSHSLFAGEEEAEYGLRDYSIALSDYAAEEASAKAQYLAEALADAALLAAVHILGDSESADAVESKARELMLTGNESVLYRAITNVLKDSNNNLSDEDIERYLAVLRHALNGEVAKVGVINANFTLELSYEEYLAFLYYLHIIDTFKDSDGNLFYGFTAVKTCTLYEDAIAAQAELNALSEQSDAMPFRMYEFNISLYVLRPMEIFENIGTNSNLQPVTE
jgi:hypothetical protein